MNETRCFILEPTGRVKLWLRRFQFSNVRKCSVTGHYCNAMVDFGEADAAPDPGGYLSAKDHLAPPHDDPRWPTKCVACGVLFAVEDPFQVFQKQLYRRADNGQICTTEEAPPGAMWEAWWMGTDYRCHDGRPWCVKLPNGFEWLPGGPSSNANGTHGPGWQTSGTAPNLTATPSIWANQGKPNDWHGFLTNGVLRRC